MWTKGIATLLGCGLIVAAPASQTPPRPVTAETGIIVGRTVDSASAPVAGAIVTLSGPSEWMARTGASAPVRRVITDEHGDFFFIELPAGQFWIRAQKDGYAEGAFGQDQPSGGGDSLSLESGARRTDLSIRLWKFASVSGTVTNETGAPIAGASVGVFVRSVRAGHPQLEAVSVHGGQTNDRGEYRLFDLVPGEYVFAFRRSSPAFILPVSGTGSGRQAFVYPTALSPSPSADGTLEFVRIAAGQALSGVDFRVVAVPAVRVSGAVQGVESFAGTVVQLRPERSIGGGLPAAQSITTRPDGTFAFDSVPTGTYVLRALKTPPTPSDSPRPPDTVIQTQTPLGQITTSFNLSNQAQVPSSPRAPEPRWWAEVALAVGASDIADVTIDLRPGVQVSGRLEFDGASPLPGTTRGRFPLTIEIERADGAQTPGSQRRATVTSNTLFTMTGVVPGRYVIRVSQESGWVLRSATLGGRDVSAIPFEVGSTDVNDVALVFTDQLTLVQGYVRNDRGEPQRGAEVIVFPVDRHLWTDYGERSPRIQRRALMTGFPFVSLLMPPGDYYVVAAASKDLDAAWADPAMLTRLAAVAERVSLREGDQQKIDLPVRGVR